MKEQQKYAESQKAIQKFSYDKLKVLIVVPLALVYFVFKIRRVWRLFEITDIISQNGENESEQ